MSGQFSRRLVRGGTPARSTWLARPETMRLAVEALARSIISRADAGLGESRDVVLQGVILALLMPRAVSGE